MAEQSPATEDDWFRVFNENPKTAVAEMPELGEGKVVNFRTQLNMADFALFTSRRLSDDYDPYTYAALVFSRLALNEKGTPLVDYNQEWFLDTALVNGKLAQLAVVRSGILKIVGQEIDAFLEAIKGEKEDKSAKKLPLPSSSTISPKQQDESQEQ